MWEGFKTWVETRWLGLRTLSHSLHSCLYWMFSNSNVLELPLGWAEGSPISSMQWFFFKWWFSDYCSWLSSLSISSSWDDYHVCSLNYPIKLTASSSQEGRSTQMALQSLLSCFSLVLNHAWGIPKPHLHPADLQTLPYVNKNVKNGLAFSLSQLPWRHPCAS